MPIDLKKINSGKKVRPPRVTIYSADGVGKTQFAAGAPDPFFLDVNKGSEQYDVKRVVPETWTEALEWVHAVEIDQVKCGSLVVDALGDLEHMGNSEFFGKDTIDTYGGGYGKGETLAVARWREFLSAVERVWLKGKPIIFTAHQKVKNFNDPTGPGYDRFQLSLRDQIAGVVRQWSDFVFWAREDVAKQKVGNSVKAVTTDVRWAYTKRTPAYDAKSRGTTSFPERFLLSWDEFMRVRSEDDARAQQIRAEIDAMLQEINDKTLTAKVESYLKSEPNKLVEARNQVAVRLEERRQAATPQQQTETAK